MSIFGTYFASKERSYSVIGYIHNQYPHGFWAIFVQHYHQTSPSCRDLQSHNLCLWEFSEDELAKDSRNFSSNNSLNIRLKVLEKSLVIHRTRIDRPCLWIVLVEVADRFSLPQLGLLVLNDMTD